MVKSVMSGKLKLKGHLKHLAQAGTVFVRSADCIEHSGICDQHQSRCGCHDGKRPLSCGSDYTSVLSQTIDV